MRICQWYIYISCHGNISTMSGHSKWSTIKRDKAVTDAKRGNLFTKVSRLITVAVKKGGGDPNANPALRLALDKAKEARMSKDTVEKAIDRGLGKGTEGTLDEVAYEGFGPNGEAFYVSAITDNRNRTVAEIRSIFGKAGGKLGTVGSTAYIFKDPENPTFMVEVGDNKEKLLNLYNQLDEHDDVQQVYVNFNL